MAESARGHQARDRILGAAQSLVKERGAGGVTVEAIAKAAGSAKGLVHYHFKTKHDLFDAVADRLASEREARWQDAFSAGGLGEAIDRTWSALTEESGDGTVRAWYSLVGSEAVLADQVAKRLVERFGQTISDQLVHMVNNELGRSPTVRPHEIGRLLAAVIDGMGLQLLAGVAAGDLDGAYAAAWLGILSLTEAGP